METLYEQLKRRIEGNRHYEFRKSGDEYYVWFDLKKGEAVSVKIEN